MKGLLAELHPAEGKHNAVDLFARKREPQSHTFADESLLVLNLPTTGVVKAFVACVNQCIEGVIHYDLAQQTSFGRKKKIGERYGTYQSKRTGTQLRSPLKR